MHIAYNIYARSPHRNLVTRNIPRKVSQESSDKKHAKKSSQKSSDKKHAKKSSQKSSDKEHTKKGFTRI